MVKEEENMRKERERRVKKRERRGKMECGRMRKRETGRTSKKQVKQIVSNEYYDVSINLLC